MDFSSPYLIRAKLLTLAETGLAIVTCGVSRKPPAFVKGESRFFYFSQSPIIVTRIWGLALKETSKIVLVSFVLLV
jgi:hypothetical protein